MRQMVKDNFDNDYYGCHQIISIIWVSVSIIITTKNENVISEGIKSIF